MLLELTFYLAENATPLQHRECREAGSRLETTQKPQQILTKHTSDKSYETIFSNFWESRYIYFFLNFLSEGANNPSTLLSTM